MHDIHYRISGEKEDLLLQYEPSIEDIFFEDELSRVKERDMRQCMTSVGPHRDDLLFSIGEVDIQEVRFAGTAENFSSVLGNCQRLN